MLKRVFGSSSAAYKGRFLLNIIPVQTEIWELSFEFVLELEVQTWHNILRLTTAAAENSLHTMGWRLPSIYVHANKLGIRYSSDTQGSAPALDIPIDLNRKHQLKMRQYRNFYDTGQLFKDVFLDGELVAHRVHGQYQEPFRNVKFFLSERNYRSAPVRVTNLIYTPNLLYPGMLHSLSFNSKILSLKT